MSWTSSRSRPRDATAIGVSADEALAFVAGDHEASLTWDSGGTVEAWVHVVPRGEPRLLRTDGCGDSIAVDVAVTMRTTDGRIDQRIRGELHIHSWGEADLWVAVPARDLEGSFQLSGAYRDAWVDFTFWFAPDGMDGELFARVYEGADDERELVDHWRVASWSSYGD